jgi:hypothetical protein
MFASREALEQVLEADLDRLYEGLPDDWSSVELYRALSGTRWTKGHGHVSLSADRAAALLNEMRERHEKVVLELQQSGGEGEISDRAAEMLHSLGWVHKPRRFERHAPARATAEAA